MEPFISIIVPTRNEESELPETLRRALAVPEILEIIVSDSGSADRTVEIARQHGCHATISRPGRGTQLRHGSILACGDVVLFLHADTWLPPDAGRAIARRLEDPQTVGGGFWKVFRDPHWLMRGSRWRCWTRLHWFGRLAADQGIFVRRSALEAIGGVPDVPLMEEFELCRKLRSQGKLVLAPATVSTSSRRWHRDGVLRTYWKMARIVSAYHQGVPPAELAARYDRGIKD